MLLCLRRQRPWRLWPRRAASATGGDAGRTDEGGVSLGEGRVCEHHDGLLELSQRSVELWHKLSHLAPDSPPDARTLKVAVLGPTSVGKSSLVNMLSSYRSCAVSQKINTTRSKQAVVCTRGSTQLVFVDLPGLLSEQRRRRFNLENFVMRDVHSCVFGADLILAVADASHIPSRTRIDSEVLKALHYFSDKPSVLVVNKIDRMRGSRVKLLDMVRQLTDGVVAGRVSHVDRYAGRIREIDAKVERLLQLQQKKEQQQQQQQQLEQQEQAEWPEEAAEAASCWHRRLQRHLVPPIAQLQLQLLPPSDVTAWGAGPPAPTPLLSDDDRRRLLLRPAEEAEEAEEAQEAEEAERLLLAPTDEASDSPLALPELPPAAAADAAAGDSQLRPVRAADVDPFTLFLRDQLLMGSVTKEQAIARRRRWRDIAARIHGQTAWRGFQEVFLVSAATGEGVDRLRDFLFSSAVAGRWHFHSSCLSDAEPQELIRMCVWARCLDALPEEVPYRLRFELLDLERAPDGRVFVSVRILCPSTRALTLVIGQDGATIQDIARQAKEELQDVFRANVTLKLLAARATVPAQHLRAVRRAKSFSQLFPDIMH